MFVSERTSPMHNIAADLPFLYSQRSRIRTNLVGTERERKRNTERNATAMLMMMMIEFLSASVDVDGGWNNT